jgi:hypothetical protein
MTTRLLWVLLVVVAGVSGCAGGDDATTAVDPSPLGGDLEASPGTTSEEICAAAAAVERSVDDLDATSTEAWRALQAQVRQAYDDFLAVAGDEFPEAVASFEARLVDFNQAIDEARDDPLSGPLVLEDTSEELSIAGDRLVAELDCDVL